MRSLVLLVALASTACSIPSYLVRPADLAAARAPAVRERDGQPVTLVGGSFRATSDAPLADGSVRVRGTGRHNKMWKAGMAVTLIGIPLAIGGALLGVAAVSPGSGGYTGDLTEGSGRMTDRGAAMLGFGIALGVVGDIATLGVGPGLWIAGARRAPVALPQ